MRKILVIILAVIAVTGCEKKPNPVIAEPTNYIQVNDGEKQEILASAFVLIDGEGYAFSFSPMNSTNRQAGEMIERFACDIPIELMGLDIDLATSNLEGAEMGLMFNYRKEILYNSNFWYDGYATTGTLKVSCTEGNNFIVDFKDCLFDDGRKVTLHYEGEVTEIDKDEYADNIIAVTKIDLQIGTEIIKLEGAGYIGANTEIIGEGVMVSNLEGELDGGFFYTFGLNDPEGGKYIEATYPALIDYPYTTFCYDGFVMLDDPFIYGAVVTGNSGTLDFAKTATSYTMTFDEVELSGYGAMTGTIFVDADATIPQSAIPAPKHIKRHNW